MRAEEIGQHEEKIPGMRILDLGAQRGVAEAALETGQVDVQCAELLPESDDLLRDHVLGRPPEQDEDSIMRAVPRDHEGSIALSFLAARKR